MKYIAMIALAAVALSFGACANKSHSTPPPTTTSASTGYSK